ncbi:MAG: hypothetical protein ACJA00_001389 [Myxococcota bacterium]|jgi:hypothetical protein
MVAIAYLKATADWEDELKRAGELQSLVYRVQAIAKGNRVSVAADREDIAQSAIIVMLVRNKKYPMPLEDEKSFINTVARRMAWRHYSVSSPLRASAESDYIDNRAGTVVGIFNDAFIQDNWDLIKTATAEPNEISYPTRRKAKQALKVIIASAMGTVMLLLLALPMLTAPPGADNAYGRALTQFRANAEAGEEGLTQPGDVPGAGRFRAWGEAPF